MKKNNKNKREKIMEFISYIGTFLCIILPLIILEISIILDKDLTKYINITFAIGIILGLVFTALVFLPSTKISIPKSIPIKLKLGFKTYKELSEYLKEKLSKANYELKYNIEEKEIKIEYYCKKIFIEKIEVVSIIKVNEFKEEMLEKIYDNLEEVLKVINNKRRYLYFIPVIIVDEESKDFNDYTEMPFIQQRNDFLLPIGYSLKNETLYIVNQESDLGIVKFQEIKSRFIKTFELKEFPIEK